MHQDFIPSVLTDKRGGVSTVRILKTAISALNEYAERLADEDTDQSVRIYELDCVIEDMTVMLNNVKN